MLAPNNYGYIVPFVFTYVFIGFVRNGKENQNTDKKRSLRENTEEEEDEPVKPKKRRLIIPDVESDEDSGDEFKPSLLIAIIFLNY